eukprot:30760_1
MAKLFVIAYLIVIGAFLHFLIYLWYQFHVDARMHMRMWTPTLVDTLSAPPARSTDWSHRTHWIADQNLIQRECFVQTIRRMNRTNEKENESQYLDLIRFYFVDWQNTTDPLWFDIDGCISWHFEEFVTIYGTERLDLLSKHKNRVYNIHDANVIIFGYDTANEGGNYPCKGITAKTVLHFSGNSIKISNRTGGWTRPDARSDELIECLYQYILSLNTRYKMPIFMFDNAWSSKALYLSAFMSKNHDYNHTNHSHINLHDVIIAKFGFLNTGGYRSAIDIQLPPPTHHDFHSEAVNKDICRKRSYLVSFLGKIRRDVRVRTHLQDIKKRSSDYNKTLIQIVNTQSEGARKNYKQIMMESTYLLILAGDMEWSYRFREGLQTYNILILIGMDHLIMPFENVINYTEWYANHGIIPIELHTFLSITTLEEFQQRIIPNLTEMEICNAHTYNKKMVDLYFKDSISEVNGLLFSLQQRILERNKTITV